MVTMSPSIPVISEMLVTLRAVGEPGLLDDDLITDEICWRMPRSGGRVAPIAIIVSIWSRIARRVGVHRRQRSVVAGVHGLKHVDASSPRTSPTTMRSGHTEGVDHQLALADRALAFDVGQPRFEADDVFLMQLQLGRVLDGHDALALADEPGQHVEQVVLPAPVPPLIRQFRRARTACEEVHHQPRSARSITRSSPFRRPPENAGSTAPGRRRRAAE